MKKLHIYCYLLLFSQVTLAQNMSSFPYIENFESGKGGWNSYYLDYSTDDNEAIQSNKLWQHGIPSGNFINSAHSGTKAWITNLNGLYGSGSNDIMLEDVVLVSPVFDFSNFVNDPLLSLEVIYDLDRNEDSYVTIEYTTDGTLDDYNTIGAYSSGGINWYENYNEDDYYGGTISDWKNAIHKLTGMAGQSNVQIIVRFQNYTDYVTGNEGFGIDDVTITESEAETDIEIMYASISNESSILSTDEEIEVGYKVNLTELEEIEITLNVTGPLTYTTSETLTGQSLNPGAINFYTFNGIGFSSPGEYVVDVTVTTPGDLIVENNTKQIYVSNGVTISSFPYLEDFESGPAGWTVRTYDQNQWELGKSLSTLPNINTANSGNNAWVTNLNGYYGEQDWAELISPVFDLSTMTDPVLIFNINYDIAPFEDEVSVHYSTDDGSSWPRLGDSESGGFNWYNGNDNGWHDNSEGWKKAAHRLDGLGGQNAVRLLLHKTASGSTPSGEGFSVDDIQIIDGAVDAGIVSVICPIESGLGDNESIDVEIEAVFGTIDNIDVTVTATGVNSFTHNQNFSTLNIAEGNTQILTITSLDFSIVGTYDLAIEISTSSDLFSSNNTTTSTAVNRTNAISTFPYIENFESENEDWFADNQGSLNGWENGTPNSQVINKAAAGDKAWVTNLDGNYSSSDIYYLHTPEFDFTSTVSPYMSFNIFYELASDDKTLVEYSFDNGTTWQLLATNLTGSNWYNSATGSWLGSSEKWINSWISLADLNGQSSVIFRFKFESDASGVSEGVAIDDFKIVGDPSRVAALSSIAPIHGGLGTNEEVKITIDVQDKDIAELDVKVEVMSPSSSYVVTQNFSGLSVAAGTQEELTLTGFDFSELGLHTLNIEISSPNDYDYSDNTISGNAGNLVQINEFPYTIDFESGTGGWIPVNSSNIGWEHGIPSRLAFYISSANSGDNAWVTNLDNRHANQTIEYLYTPEFDFSALSQDPALSAFTDVSVFDNGSDHANVEFSTDQGMTWNLLGSESSTAHNWYNNPLGWQYTEDFWKEVSHKLTGLNGESSVMFRFKLESDSDGANFYGFGVDDFTISPSAVDIGIESVQVPFKSGLTDSESISLDVKALYQTIENVTVKIQVNGPITYSHFVDFTGLSFTSGSINTLNVDDLDFSVPGEYDVSISVEIPNDAISSNNTKLVRAANLQVVRQFPYKEDFESGKGGWIEENINITGLPDEKGWDLGEPSFSRMDQAFSGDNAWATNLKSKTSEDATYYLYSPEFDFSNRTEDPFFSFYFQCLLFNTGEFFVEYSTDQGTSWSNLGNTNSGGINWYNYTDGSTDHWEETEFISGDFVQAKHKLTGLGGESSVRLRMVLNSINVASSGAVIDDVNVDYQESATFPYSNNFEDNAAGWLTQNDILKEYTRLYGWELTTPSDAHLNSAYSGNNSWVTRNNGNYSRSAFYNLYFPKLDLSQLSQDPVISFYQNRKIFSGDYATIEYSIDGGIVWTKLGTTSSGGKNWYSTASGFTGTTPSWTQSAHVLTGLAGQSNVLLKVLLSAPNSTGFDEGIAIDDVKIDSLYSNAGPDQTLCEVTTTNLSANNPVVGTGTWIITDNSDGLGVVSEPNNPNSQFIGTNGQSYTLEWSIAPEGGDFVAPINDPVVINFSNSTSVTSADAGIDQSICNSTVALSANIANTSDGETGEWTILEGAGGSISNPNNALSDFTGISGTTYTLKWHVSAASGCSTEDYVSITLEEGPSTASAGSDQSICGTVAALSANLPSIGTGSWAITNGVGGNINDVNNPNSTFSGEASVTYTLKWNISNGSCTTTQDEVNIEFVTAPSISVAGNDQSICGTSTTLEANTPEIGNGSWTVISGEDATLEQATNPNTSFTGIIGSNYILKWEINNELCTASSSTVNISLDNEPTTSEAGSDQALCDLNITTLNANIPSVGTGKWSIVSGNNGSFVAANSAVSDFTGDLNEEYILRWTIENGSCETSSDDVTINFSTTPTAANAGSDQSPCGETNLQANNPEIGIGTWEIISGTNGVISDPNSHTSLFNGSPGEIYELRWTISNGGCTPTSDEVIVIFDSNSPTISNAGNDQTLCTNTTTTLTGNTPTVGTGNWEIVVGTGGIISDPSNPASSFSGEIDKSYLLRWIITSGSCGVFSSDEVVIGFDNPPTTSIAGNDQQVCGSSATLTANTPSSGVGRWSVENGEGGTVSDPLNPISTFRGDKDVLYTLRWTISTGSCTESFDEVNIQFSANPTVANAGDDQTVCSAVVSLTANTPAVGTGVWTIESGTGGILNDDNSPVSDFSGNAGETYTLRWTISNGSCIETTDDVIITFDSASPTLSEAGIDQVLCTTSATLAANEPTSGDGMWSIENGSRGVISNPAEATSTFTGTAGETYTLRWTISSNSCSSSIDEVTITFDDEPTSSNAGMGQNLCGTNTTLEANTPIIGIGTWSIESGIGGTISELNNPISDFNGNAGEIYQLKWTTSNGTCSSSSDLVSITFDANPTTASAGDDQTLCGTTTTLDANTPSTGSGSWSIESGAGGTVSELSNPISDFNGNAGETYELKWTTSNGTCSSSSDLVNITFDADPTTANAGSDQTLCGNTTVLDANTPTIGTGTWSVESGTGGTVSELNNPISDFNGNSGETYELKWIITNGTCSNSSDLVRIIFDADPTTANAGSDQTLCGTTTALEANISSIGTGSWSIESGAGGIITEPTNPTSDFNGNDGETYELKWTITNGTCSNSSDLATIIFDAEPTTTNAGSDQTLCGTTTTLEANTPSIGTGTWSIESGAGGIITEPTNPNSAFGGNTGANYVLKWTISNGTCSNSSDQVSVEFNETPEKPIITMDSKTLSINYEADTYQWFLNGAAIVSATNPTYDATESGTYTVQITVNNCQSEISEGFDFVITGLSDSMDKTSINVYPNPIEGNMLYVEFEDKSAITIKLKFFDLQGKIASINEFSGNHTITMDVSAFQKGIYFLHIIEKDRVINIKKILIR